MTASLVMNTHPAILQMDETIAKGITMVMQHRYRSIPVVDDQGCYLGIFGVHCLLKMVLPKAVLLEGGLNTVPYVSDTLRDLRHRLKDVEDKPVTYCMSQDANVLAPDTPLVETLLAIYHSQSSLPVVEPTSKRLVGMVSYWDVGQQILAQEL